MTTRLYDHGDCLTFSAVVLNCIPHNDDWAVLLNQSAFFPGGGGQAADSGTLDGLPLRGIYEEKGELWHCVDAPLTIGATVEGCIDADLRLRRMQNHSGEHIISGLIWREHRLNNIGFHMGQEDVTLDLDGTLTREQLDRIETMANEIIAQNLPISIDYPAQEQLAALEYRSKLDLTENVRIVSIGENGSVDRCACCAPHLARTGQIGIIKLLDFIHYKGGIRIHMLCGLDALRDYRERYEAVSSIAASLSVKQNGVLEAVSRLENEIGAHKAKQTALCNRLIDMHVQAIDTSSGQTVLIFEPLFSADSLRFLVNAALTRTDTVLALSGDDEIGYTYVLGSNLHNSRQLCAAMHSTLGGKGGGTDEMVRGKLPTKRTEIEAYFTKA